MTDWIFRRKISLRLHIWLVFMLIVWVAIALLTGLNYLKYREHLTAVAQNALEDIYEKTALQINTVFNPAIQLVDGTIADPDQLVFDANLSVEEKARLIQTKVELSLKNYPHYSSFYVGFRDGAYFTIRPPSEEVKNKLGIDPIHQKTMNQGLLLISPHHPKATHQWLYHAERNWFIAQSSPDQKFKKFDVLTRPWYRAAAIKKQGVWTNVYRFSGFSQDRIGITYSKPFYDKFGQLLGVVGINIGLESFLEFFKKIRFSPHSFIFIADKHKNLYAHSQIEIAKIKKLPPTLETIKNQRPYDILLFEKLVVSQRPQLFDFEINGEKNQIIAIKAPLNAALGLDADLYVGADIRDFTHLADSIVISNIQMTLVIALIVSVIIFLISKQISKPINQLTKDIEEIRLLRFDHPFDDIQSRIAEIQELNTATKLMNHSLQSFSRFIPIELLHLLMKQGKPLENGGMKAEITLLFTDIANFTTISEQTEETQLFNDLTEYFSIISNIVLENNGVVDKFIGDAVMAFWGAPYPSQRQAYDACLAALLCKQAIDTLNAKWIQLGKAPYVTRFGIHRGVAFVGNIGSKKRINYTALGNTVNVASRLEGLNKQEQTSILISENVVESDPLIQRDFILREMGYRAVRGKNEQIKIYELVAHEPHHSMQSLTSLLREQQKEESGKLSN